MAAFFFYYYERNFYRYRIYILFLGLICLTIIAYTTHKNITGHEGTMVYYFNRYIHLSVSAIGFTCLLPFFYYLNNLNKISITVASFFSAVSYSLYLINIPVYEVLDEIAMNIWLKYILYWAICIYLSWITFRYFEQPILKLRDKNFK